MTKRSAHNRQRAKALHRSAIVVDTHSDSALHIASKGWQMDALYQRDEGHEDVKRMLRGGVDVQLLACCNGVAGKNPLDLTLSVIEQVLSLAERHSDETAIVRNVSEIRAAKRKGKAAFTLSLESGRMLHGDLHILHILHRLGIRLIDITHGSEGPDPKQRLIKRDSVFGFCTAAARRRSARSKKGLTPFGVEVVKEMNQCGIVVSLAHSTDSAFYHVLDVSDAPVVVSHGNVFSLSPHWRNSTDDMLRALAQKGGVIGLAFFPDFIHPESPSLEKLIDQYVYVADLVGVEHLGIGSDFDGMGSAKPVIPSANKMPLLTEALLKRGFKDAEVRKILGGNSLRVFAEVMG